MHSRFCPTSVVILFASVVILVARFPTTTNGSALSPDEHDETLKEALGLFMPYLDCDEQCTMTTRLTEIKADLSLNSPDSLAGMDKSSLVKAHPEVAKTADFLLFRDRKVIMQLADGLFGIVTSNCRPEVRTLEQSLRKKLDEWRWPAKMRLMVKIIETYEGDCLHGLVTSDDMDDIDELQ